MLDYVIALFCLENSMKEVSDQIEELASLRQEAPDEEEKRTRNRDSASPTMRKIRKMRTRVDDGAGFSTLKMSKSQLRGSVSATLSSALSKFAQRGKEIISLLEFPKENLQQLVDFTAALPWLMPLRKKQELWRNIASKFQREVGLIPARFRINRNRQIDDSIFHLNRFSHQDLRRLKISVEYVGEEGIDEGGIYREWLNSTLLSLLTPRFGLFTVTANQQSLQPNPIGKMIPEKRNYYRLVGRLLGFALRDNVKVEVPLSRPLLKQIIGRTITVSDLNDVDPELYKSLTWLLDNPVDEAEAKQFVYKVNVFGAEYEIHLFGSDPRFQVVSEENKKMFVKSVAHAKLVKEIDEQVTELRAGIVDIIPDIALRMFTASEVDKLLVGEQKVNIKEMQEYAKYDGWEADDEVITWFWEIVNEIDQETLSSLIFFITEAVVRTFYNSFSRVDIPDYLSKEKLEDRLMKAILEGKGFYLA